MHARVTTLFALSLQLTVSASSADAWPRTTRETRPWTYWWWMGSAVDPTNLVRELDRYQAAGLGGVHIIPIYGARGWESNAVPFLSPQWMSLLDRTVREAGRRGLGVDMTTGTGWCFGGPEVTNEEANARFVVKTFELQPGESLAAVVLTQPWLALRAFTAQGIPLDLDPGATAPEAGTTFWPTAAPRRSRDTSPCPTRAVAPSRWIR